MRPHTLPLPRQVLSRLGSPSTSRSPLRMLLTTCQPPTPGRSNSPALTTKHTCRPVHRLQAVQETFRPPLRTPAPKPSLPRTRSSLPLQELRVRLPSVLLPRSLSPQTPRRLGLSAWSMARAKANPSGVLVLTAALHAAVRVREDVRGSQIATSSSADFPASK